LRLSWLQKPWATAKFFNGKSNNTKTMEATLYNGNSRIWIRREPGCDFNLYGTLNAADSPNAADSISKIPKTASVIEACDLLVGMGWTLSK